MIIGMNQRFHPKHSAIRLFYGFMLIMMFVTWQPVFWYGYIFKDPVQKRQISTIDEIIEMDFRLVGSTEVQSLIAFDNRVTVFFFDSVNYEL